MIALSCHRCGQKVEMAAAPASRRVICPHCGQELPAPTDQMAVTATDAGYRETGPDEEERSLIAESKEGLQAPQGAGEIGRLGPYRVLRVLGMGGMGLVYEAEDTRLERLVALKVMKPELAQRESGRERFLREARTAARIEHPHVVTIYQVDQDRGIPYLAMPLLKGETLADCLQREGRLSVPELLRVGKQIASGLAAAHERGLIHRDIKPDNIFLVPDNEASAGAGPGPAQVKIVDFGLARQVSADVNLTRSGAILGTPAFMAPEQARGEEIDHRVDLFSLGCVLYRAATGKLPFPGDDPLTLFTALATHEPKAPRSLNGALPPPLSELIQRLLAKKREQRPATARAVIAELERIELAYLGKPGVNLGATQQLPAAAKRRFWPAALGMLVGLAAVVLFVINNPFARQEKPPVDENKNTPAAHKGLDAFSAASIPAVYHFEKQPAELVGVLEEDRPGAIDQLAFDAGNLLATGGKEGATVWDLSGAKPSRRATIAVSSVHTLAFLPGKEQLAVGAGSDLRFWDVATAGKPRVTTAYRGAAPVAAVAPDGKHFAVCDKLVRYFKLMDGDRYEEVGLLPASATAMTFSGNGSVLTCATPIGLVFLDLAVKGLKRKPLPDRRFKPKALAFAPRGLLFALVNADSDSVQLYELVGDEPRLKAQLESPGLNGETAGLTFAPDGNQLALKRGDGLIVVWNDLSKTLDKLVDDHRVIPLPASPPVLTFAADGRHLFTSGPNGLVYVLRLANE